MGKKRRSADWVRFHTKSEWAEMELCLNHFGGFLISHGRCGDTAGEGDDHLILPLPSLFNETKDSIRLKKLTVSLGLVLVGGFLKGDRQHGLWVAPEKGLSFADALLLLEKKGGHRLK
jgi:hypothetical protein